MSCCLKPPYSGIEPGWQDGFPSVALPVVADEWNEYIEFNLPQNVFLVDIPFTVIKASAKITGHGLMIHNTVDLNQIIPSFNIVETTVSKMRIMLDQQLDSANYWFKGLVSVIG